MSNCWGQWEQRIMMNHRAAQSESIAKLIGVPGKWIKHGAADLTFEPHIFSCP